MPTRGSDAQQAENIGYGDSSPELFPSGHQSRLAMPRDWSSALNRRRSKGSGGSANGSCRKEQRQSQLKTDGEWFCESAASRAEKDPEQESPAMRLLCSITNASANALPAIRSPRLQARPRQRDQPRPQFASINSAGSRSGEFYRLPWYRRPLPSHRRTGVANAEMELKRRNSVTGAPRVGLRAPGVSIGAAVAPATTVGGAAASAAKEGARDLGQEQEEEQPSVGIRGPTQGEAIVVETNKAGSTNLGSPPSSVGSSSSAFEVVADRGATPDQAAAREMSGAVAVVAPTAEEVDDTPAANSMAADRDEEQVNVEDVADVTDELEAPPKDKGADTDEVKRLRAEVDRLKREMALMTAAAAKCTTTPPTAESERGKAHRPSPRIDVTSPVLSSPRGVPSTWEGEPAAVEADEAFDTGKSTRPVSARVRADKSWMHRQHSVGSSDGSQPKWQNDSAEGSANNGTDFWGSARAGSVLPPPGSDYSSGQSRPPSDHDSGGAQSLPTNGELLLSPPASLAKVEGPSPASGEKGEEAKAAAADTRRRLTSGTDPTVEGSGGARRRLASGTDPIVEGSGGGESARSNNSMRQMSVFFPVQQPSSEPEAAQATRGSRAVAQEGAAALARAAATQIGATVTPPEAGRAAQAARDSFFAKEQQVAAGHVAVAPVVYTKVPVPASASATGLRGACRRRGAGDSNGRVWRWVVAQRTGNKAVRQALISHGLPPCGRHHIWAAWASVATPETYSRGKTPSDPAKEGSVVNVIVHDVARTKIVHPLFESGGQGLAMLKRVLIRCAELGAVKEAGYIQGMNYLAGFVLITLADCVLSEREDGPPPRSREPGSVESNSSTTISNGSALPPGDSPQSGVAAASGGDAVGAEPTAAEIDRIEGECVQVMQGVIALQGGVLSRDLWGLHANTELVEDLLSKHCPDVMDHLRMVHLELIVLTPRWFICIYAGSMTSQAVVTRIWDLFMWYGRRGPAVLVWVALGILHGCRQRMFESRSLPAAVKAVRRHAEGCKTFDDLARQAPVGLHQVVAAWEAQGNNRRIAALDGEGVIPDRIAAGLVGEMTGEPALVPPKDALSPPRHHRRSHSGVPSGASASTFGIQFPSTPGRSPTPLTSPRSPFPEWAANIFRSSAGGGAFENGEGSAYVEKRGGGGAGGSLPPSSPKFSTPSNTSNTRQFRRSASTSWW